MHGNVNVKLQKSFVLLVAVSFLSSHSLLLYGLETSPNAIRSTSNPIRIALGSNCDLSAEKPASNKLSYGKMFVWFWHKIWDLNNE